MEQLSLTDLRRQGTASNPITLNDETKIQVSQKHYYDFLYFFWDGEADNPQTQLYKQFFTRAVMKQ
jgi:hypothetical protein